MLEKLKAPSRRDCPLCGSKTHYVQTLMGRMTGFSMRRCTHCAYVDPVKVRLYPQLEPGHTVPPPDIKSPRHS